MMLILLMGCSSENDGVKVTLVDQNKTFTASHKDTLAEALKDQGYDIEDLKKRYQPSIPWEQKLEGKDEVKLACKCNVTLHVGGKEEGTFQTTKATVKEVLEEKQVTLTEWDEVNLPLEQRITDGTTIVVDRMEQRLQKKVEILPFETKEEKDNKIAEGEKKVEQEGKEGKKIYQVLMLYKNGQPVMKEGKPVVEQKLVETIKPVQKIVKIGTNKELAKKDDINLATAGTLTVQATGYTHTGNRTATGTWPKRGTIAVDPRVIPLGTRIYVPGYGYGVAEDTGGAVKGRIIDLFFESRAEAIKWGRRTVTIQILK